MAIGPGRYDKECTLIRKKTGAEGIILLVFSGEKGSGFSCQAPLDVTRRLPSILRELAEKIEADKDL
jgi:hypothetical protein